MSDNPKFEVIDRRKFKAEEEHETREPERQPEQPKKPPESSSGPRLVANDHRNEPATETTSPPDESGDELLQPSPEESHQQKADYEASAQRIDDLIRAQNPAAGAQPPVTFEHLVQQVYLTAMLQMGAGIPEGGPARVDIVGARASIDMLGILAEKTKGNLTAQEERGLQTVLYDARMAFLELSKMISLQGVHSPPPPKR